MVDERHQRPTMSSYNTVPLTVLHKIIYSYGTYSGVCMTALRMYSTYSIQNLAVNTTVCILT
jgi:hypothetical protein